MIGAMKPTYISQRSLNACEGSTTLQVDTKFKKKATLHINAKFQISKCYLTHPSKQ